MDRILITEPVFNIKHLLKTSFLKKANLKWNFILKRGFITELTFRGPLRSIQNKIILNSNRIKDLIRD